MWGSVLGLGLMAALNPLRLGLALLMISRRRPVQNLLAFWAGGLTLSVPELLVPLVALHFTSMFTFARRNSSSASPNSILAHIQLGIGAIGLTIAAILALRFFLRQRTKDGASIDNCVNSRAQVDAPVAIPRLLRRPQDPDKGGSTFRWLLGRAHDAWENGSLWVAWVIGLAAVPVDGVLFMVAIIAASGAAMATQLSAALAFVLVMYAAVEIILIGYFARPTKTHALLRLLHDWVRTYQRQILVVMFTIVGVSQLAQGMSGG
ncbi:hypothetical protein A5647_02690 [Mycobacterium sp. 1100029.7]|nr:hypothetical protein A5647_02690 [Mycobacterium sp. 1100029.7]